MYAGSGGERVDRYVLHSVAGLSPGQFHRYLRENKIKLNGKKPAAGTPLRAGDVLRLYLPQAALRQQDIVYEDENLLAVCKAAGIATCAPGGADSLLSRAAAHCAAQGNPAPELCHRLDTGTSGLVLLAKTPEALDFVTDLIRRRAIEKTYLGLSVGHPRPPRGTVSGYLVKDAQRGTVRAAPKAARGAKPAETAYETAAVCGRLALLRIFPLTGRTHQIRVHMAQLGTPLLGDSKYGTQAINRELRCRYQCLCAHTLRFPADVGRPDFAAYGGMELRCAEPWFWAAAQQGGLGYAHGCIDK